MKKKKDSRIVVNEHGCQLEAIPSNDIFGITSSPVIINFRFNNKLSIGLKDRIKSKCETLAAMKNAIKNNC